MNSVGAGLVLNKVKSTHGKVEDVENNSRDDTPVVKEGEDEGVGGEAEDDVPQVEGEVAEGHMEGQLGLGDAVKWRRNHRSCVQVKHCLEDGEE